MTEMIWQVPATVAKVVTLTKGQIRLWVETQELTPEDTAKAMNFHEKLGWLTFSVQERKIKPEDLLSLPEIKPEAWEKSPSQKLYGRMFVYFKQKKGTDEGFREWYEKYLDDMGKKFLDQLQ